MSKCPIADPALKGQMECWGHPAVYKWTFSAQWCLLLSWICGISYASNWKHFSPLVNLTSTVCKYIKMITVCMQWGRRCWVFRHVENKPVQGELIVSICSTPLFHSEGTDKIHSNAVLGDSQLFLDIDNFIISSKTEKAFKYPPERNSFCMPLTCCTSFHYSSHCSVCNSFVLWMILSSCKNSICTPQMKCTACVSSSFSTHLILV